MNVWSAFIVWKQYKLSNDIHYKQKALTFIINTHNYIKQINKIFQTIAWYTFEGFNKTEVN